ncbi:putative tubulin-tyrosine ligase protein [Rosellinia necatrix]|uniref:Putative tubulin-tyrosine ligase protein n=1 Tax=Rosellinia necatrix TaxID=77044 RepID=A0A1W2TJ96_ROSNE|nr:putative tubulin-tyrosine ligase protein [Rosellinia necatrix]
MQYIQAPYRAATSSTAKRTYISTALFVSAASLLLGIAVFAYPVFYYNYVPKKLITLPVHLQYNAGPNPHGIVYLPPDLMLEQEYDVSIDLTLPRSPANIDRGNFMVALYAMKSVVTNPSLSFATYTNPYQYVTPSNVLFSSRRPVLIPYEDPLVTTASRILFLLYHILFTHSSETVKLSIPMGELVEFRGVAPLSLLVDVQAGQTLQVYSSTVTLVARLSGVRWFMYNHRILSFLVCTAVFWLAEMVSMGLAWYVLRQLFQDQGGRASAVWRKDDPERMKPGDATDHERDLALKTEDDVMIKKEASDFDSEPDTPDTGPQHAGDADDEGDSDDGRGEFGAGTSFHDGRAGGQVRRRVSRGEST